MKELDYKNSFDYDFCLNLFNSYDKNLGKIPTEYHTETLFEIAYDDYRINLGEIIDKNDWYFIDTYISFLSKFNSIDITPEIAKFAINKNSFDLKYTPPYLRTKELFETTLSSNILILKYIPPELRTLELCKIAISKSTMCIDYIPTNLHEELKIKKLADNIYKYRDNYVIYGIFMELCDMDCIKKIFRMYKEWNRYLYNSYLEITYITRKAKL